MKHFFLLLFIIALSCCKKKVIESDKEIALTLAEKTWKNAYGKSTIDRQKPFATKKKNDSIWIVSGTMSKPAIGGVAYAEVNVKTKKVINYTHGE
ncbi:NTF2 fold immunity protein [Epilithonimonas sp.]|uniref:NTF2 fold immunity protein n=1 Tax=Epilithonimonas sp. TaxID=2894511 RepID=UPI0035AFDCA2